MAAKFCEARSPAFPSPGCCGHTFTMSPDPKCRNCGEIPTLDSPNAGEAVSLCMLKLNHRGHHSWAR
jgi:hypothetical protein